MAQPNDHTGSHQTYSSPTDTLKEVAVPTQNTDKQVFDRTLDSSKEVPAPASARSATGTEDTERTLASPSDIEKEVSRPTNNTDKQTWTSDSLSLPPSGSNPILALRIEKGNSLGLIMPQNQTLLLRSLDPTTRTPQAPAFMTSEMEWIDVCAGNPPPFELFTAHDLNAPVQVARFEPMGMQGVVGMRSQLEVHVGGANASAGTAGTRETWAIVRKGVGRTYALTRDGVHGPGGFVWKGSTKAVKEVLGKGEKVGKGNFKLTAAEGGEVLAVWQQWRNSEVLGDLLLYPRASELLAAEVIVASCVSVVSADRALGLNWFGGLGK